MSEETPIYGETPAAGTESASSEGSSSEGSGERLAEGGHGMSERKAHHDRRTKEALAARMGRIEGQVRGVRRMIEEDTYCDDVLNQIAAIEAALNGVRKIILEAHIRSCVVEQLSRGETEVIDELMKTIGRMTR
jgi:DNA-binding FrmR family transcriptional regulator